MTGDSTEAVPLTTEEEARWRRHPDNWTGDDVLRLFATLDAARTAPPAPLDTAWAEAEAAMPNGWRFSISPYYPSGWEAEAHDITRTYTPGRNKHSTGTTGVFDTPAGALSALARLTEGDTDG